MYSVAKDSNPPVINNLNPKPGRPLALVVNCESVRAIVNELNSMTRADASAIGKAGLILSDQLEISLYTMGFMPITKRQSETAK